MTVRDHTGIVLDKFNGLWSREDPDTTPIDRFSDCNNIRFIGNNSFGTRPGIDISQNVAAPLANIKRIYNYPLQTANTLIVLVINETTGYGEIYHVIDKTTIYGPILTIPEMTDFAFVPYAGRAYISPFSSSLLTINPPNALTAVVVAGTGLGVGVYKYYVSLLNALGETTLSPVAEVTTSAGVVDPVVNPVVTNKGAVPGGGHSLTVGATYKWLFAYEVNGLETNVGTASGGLVAPAVTNTIGLVTSAAFPASFGASGPLVNVYRTLANGLVYYREFQTYGANIDINGGFGYLAVGTINDTDLVLQPQAPSANSTQTQKVELSSIPTTSNPPATIIDRNLWRTVANGSQPKLLTHLVNDTTDAYTDTTADGSLGANAPTVNTATIGTNIIEKGLSGEFIYVYAGDGTAARKAAGSGMTGSMTVANGAPGHTDAGFHIFGFVSQTISGYNSPPTILTGFTTNGSNSVSFGSIPTSGDPNVAKRLLVSTIAIPTYNGNLSGYQFFFVPDAVIDNNTDTFLNNISFYDADLLDDASHLLNNYTEIPAGAVLNLYHNRLVVGATADNISLALISLPGEPEAIDQVNGLIIVPLDGSPITNAQDYLDVLYVFKITKTVAYADNGLEPAFWQMTIIDNALGTCVHGIATTLNTGSASTQFLIVCTLQGVCIFNGAYIVTQGGGSTHELSWVIESYWKALDSTLFGLIQIVNAPVQKELYIVLPTGDLLVGNYGNGFDFKNIRWSPWSFFPDISTVAIYGENEIILGAVL